MNFVNNIKQGENNFAFSSEKLFKKEQLIDIDSELGSLSSMNVFRPIIFDPDISSKQLINNSQIIGYTSFSLRPSVTKTSTMKIGYYNYKSWSYLGSKNNNHYLYLLDYPLLVKDLPSQSSIGSVTFPYQIFSNFIIPEGMTYYPCGIIVDQADFSYQYGSSSMLQASSKYKYQIFSLANSESLSFASSYSYNSHDSESHLLQINLDDIITLINKETTISNATFCSNNTHINESIHYTNFSVSSNYNFLKRQIYFQFLHIFVISDEYFQSNFYDTTSTLIQNKVIEYFNNISKNYRQIYTKNIESSQKDDYIYPEVNKYLITPSEDTLYIFNTTNPPQVEDQYQLGYIWDGNTYQTLLSNNNYIYFTQSEIDSIFNPS